MKMQRPTKHALEVVNFALYNLYGFSFNEINVFEDVNDQIFEQLVCEFYLYGEYYIQVEIKKGE